MPKNGVQSIDWIVDPDIAYVLRRFGQITERPQTILPYTIVVLPQEGNQGWYCINTFAYKSHVCEILRESPQKLSRMQPTRDIVSKLKQVNNSCNCTWSLERTVGIIFVKEVAIACAH